MNAARLALSKAIQQNNYAAIQIERGDYWEARQVLPCTLYSLKQLLCLQDSTATLSDTFFDDYSQGSNKSAHRESVDEHDHSTTNHSTKLEPPSSHLSSRSIGYKRNALASIGDSDQQINLYRTPIHLDHDRRLQQASLSKAEEIAVIALSAATVIFNLALLMHLSVTTTDRKCDSSTDEAHKSRRLCCLAKAESLYRLAMELILQNIMFPDMDTFDGTLLLAIVNNLGALRLQRKEREDALVTFQYLMNILMMMVDRGIALGSDREWFLENALLAENRFSISPSLAAAA